MNGLNKAGGKGKVSRHLPNRSALHSFIKEFGQIMNYTSLYSNPTANKDVWGKSLQFSNPTAKNRDGEAQLYQNPTANKSMESPTVTKSICL